MVGDIGAIIVTIYMLSSLMVRSIAKHNYILKSIEKLFLVKTKNQSTFLSQFKKTKDQNYKFKQERFMSCVKKLYPDEVTEI